MNANDIIEDVIDMVDDLDRIVWEGDGRYVKHIAAGIKMVWYLTPESQIQSDGSIGDLVDFSTNTSLPLPIDDMYQVPLTHYVASRFFGTSAGDNFDKRRSDDHWGKFLRSLGVVSGG